MAIQVTEKFADGRESNTMFETLENFLPAGEAVEITIIPILDTFEASNPELYKTT